jgi:multicomponent Na+:H+ antiporter subunit G
MAWVADAIVVLGLLVMTVGVIGVFRMPDVYLQLHAASKAVFLGVVAFAVASVATWDAAVISRAALIAVFLIVTTPVSAHVIALAAHRTGPGRPGVEAGEPGAGEGDDAAARPSD